MYSNFDPDVKITVVEGKNFTSNDSLRKAIKAIPNVKYYVESVEETVLLKYDENQEVGKLKGVSGDFKEMTQIEQMMKHEQHGYFMLQGNGQQFSVLSYYLALKLGINPKNPYSRINIYIPTFETDAIGEMFTSIAVTPKGTFEINDDFGNYIIINKDYANELLQWGDKVSTIEIGLADDTKLEETKIALQKLMGNKFYVKSRYEQNSFLFKTLETEKWITLFILAVITFLAIFNVIGSLYMLIIDKKKDIFILQSMGATSTQIKRIFWLESFIIGVVGAVIGLILGLTLCALQDHYGFLSIGANFTIDAYPIDIQALDVVLTFVLVCGVNALTSLIPILAMK
jgi:lipoprotein-releasing system permease protein